MVSEKGLFVNEPGNKEKKSLMQDSCGTGNADGDGR